MSKDTLSQVLILKFYTHTQIQPGVSLLHLEFYQNYSRRTLQCVDILSLSFREDY